MKKIIILSLALLVSVFAQTSNNNEGTIYKYPDLASAQADMANIPVHGVIVVDGVGVVSDDGSGTLTPTTPSGAVDANGATAPGQVPVADGSGGITWTTLVDDKGTDDQDASEVEFDDTANTSWSIGTTVQAALDTIKQAINDHVIDLSTPYEWVKKQGQPYNILQVNAFGGVPVDFITGGVRVVKGGESYTIGTDFATIEDSFKYLSHIRVQDRGGVNIYIPDGEYTLTQAFDGFVEGQRINFRAQTPRLAIADADFSTNADSAIRKAENEVMLRSKHSVIINDVANVVSASSGTVRMYDLMFIGDGTGVAFQNFGERTVTINCTFFNYDDCAWTRDCGYSFFGGCVFAHSNEGLKFDTIGGRCSASGCFFVDMVELGCRSSLNSNLNVYNSLFQNCDIGVKAFWAGSSILTSNRFVNSGTYDILAEQRAFIELEGSNVYDAGKISPQPNIVGNDEALISL